MKKYEIAPAGAFSCGDVVTLNNGMNVIMEKPIGNGSVGRVYKAHLELSDGFVPCAAKHVVQASRKLYEAIKFFCENPVDSPRVIWPLNLTKMDPATNSFVYIMPLLPDNFKTLIGPIRQAGEKAMLFRDRAAIGLEISRAVADIHDKGLVLADIKASNVMFARESDGIKVILIDVDSVSIEGCNDVTGSGLYRAPEILLGASPTQQSDLHSLAVLLYYVFVCDHPLRGSHIENMVENAETIERFYARQPMFVHEPGSTNKTYRGHILRWQRLPNPVKAAFRMSFDQDRLHGRAPRLPAALWSALLSPEYLYGSASYNSVEDWMQNLQKALA